MKRRVVLAAALLMIVGVGSVLSVQYAARQSIERERYDYQESELIITNLSGSRASLFKAGSTLEEAQPITSFKGQGTWLPAGNYFLKIEHVGTDLYYPVPIVAFRGGPDDGSVIVTVRSTVPESPPALLSAPTGFADIPSGHFLIGDRLNLQDPHYVWLTGFFMARFEVTNEEFRKFMEDPDGYASDANWTEAGKRWKHSNSTKATALLKSDDDEFKRFGQPDQPVVQVNWYEANAFCVWLTRKIGAGRWIFSLPNEAEWEKAARGPDGFDYALGNAISDAEVSLYNWKKNPSAEITVIGIADSLSHYSCNRYGLYHMTGNVSEWTQSIFRALNRAHPYFEDDRNHDEVPGQRVVRGGSWYTASIAVLNIAYRENFQPEVAAPYLGFRIVARPLP